MVKMQVFRVGIDQQRGVPFVLLADEEEKRLLPIWIGPFEANAIATELRGKTFPRPLTHDLLRSVVEALGYRLTQVAVTRLEEGTFYAELTLVSEAQTIVVDARPSDAVALALRSGAIILVDDDVLARNQILATEGEEDDAQEMEKFRELLGGLEAEDEPEPGADIDS
ncbi:MAG: bifunctional nuclease family protein [Armatimonadota bacterium]